MSNEELIGTVLNAIRSVVGSQSEKIGLHEPSFSQNDFDTVKNCLESGWVSSVGKFVDEFENRIADFVGAKFAIATVNGTAALSVACRLLEVERNEEVLLPSLSFIAPANAVSYLGGIPHFVEAEELSLGPDPDKLKDYLTEVTKVEDGACWNKATGRRIRALLAVHILGHACQVERLQEICKQFHLEFLEDAAEGLGSYYKEKHVGNFGLVSTLSFNGNKIITTGGGGALITNDPNLAKRAKHLTTTAKISHPWEFSHDEVGYNFRLPSLNAALGVSQLRALNEKLKSKRGLAKLYRYAFEGINNVEVIEEPKDTKSNFWLNAIRLSGPAIEKRDDIIRTAHEQGMFLRPLWSPIHHFPMYLDCPRMDLSITEQLTGSIIQLPSSPMLFRG